MGPFSGAQFSAHGYQAAGDSVRRLEPPAEEAAVKGRHVHGWRLRWSSPGGHPALVVTVDDADRLHLVGSRCMRSRDGRNTGVPSV